MGGLVEEQSAHSGEQGRLVIEGDLHVPGVVGELREPHAGHRGDIDRHGQETEVDLQFLARLRASRPS